MIESFNVSFKYGFNNDYHHGTCVVLLVQYLCAFRLFSEIFNKVPYDNEIIFNEDCSWIPMTPKKGAPETTIVSTPAKGGNNNSKEVLI